MEKNTIVATDTISVCFINPLRRNAMFPTVGISVDGTELLVTTTVSRVLLDSVLEIERIQEALEWLLGRLEWTTSIGVERRSIALVGRRELLQNVSRASGESIIIPIVYKNLVALKKSEV